MLCRGCLALVCLWAAAGASVAGQDPRHGGTADRGERAGQSQTSMSELLAPQGPAHSVVHAAAVKHAVHKRSERSRSGVPVAAPEVTPAVPAAKNGENLAPSGVSLPNIPKRPPVCSVPPAMRFCESIDYPVYRPDEGTLSGRGSSYLT